MSEKYNSIPPEREIEYMEKAAEAAGEAAAPVITKLGELGVQEFMPSRNTHAAEIDTMEADLTLQEVRDSAIQTGRLDLGAPQTSVASVIEANRNPASFQAVRKEYGGQPPDPPAA